MKQQELNKQLLDFAEDLLEDNHQLSYKLKGNSMYPTLKAGDIGIVEKCSLEDLKIGDIIVYKTNNILVGHRLVHISISNTKYLLTTKGDKCYKSDIPFSNEALLGRINTFIRKKKNKKNGYYTHENARFYCAAFFKTSNSHLRSYASNKK